MIQNKEEIVSHINFIISELLHLKKKLTIEPGIHFNVITGPFNVMTGPYWIIIEQWDTELSEPRLLSCIDKIQKEDLEKVFIQESMKALNTLGARAYKKQIYWNSDFPWDKLPENFRKLNMIYKIEENLVSDELRHEVMGRVHDLYNMSEFPQI